MYTFTPTNYPISIRQFLNTGRGGEDMVVTKATVPVDKSTKSKTVPDYKNHFPVKQQLPDDHESLILELRKSIIHSSEKSKDAGTVDFMTSIM